MQNGKIDTISNLFEGKEIRSVWDEEKQDYYFSVVDVIGVLAKTKDASDYWTTLKKRLSNDEKSELPTKCRRLKMRAFDGKQRETDVLDTEGILRLIESVPSPKAEPFKLWLAHLGKERIDEVFDPELAINRAINYYRKKGYTDEWIKKRLNGILDRHKLTDVWKENGINKPIEYAILTNEIYKAWSNMTANEYKSYKGLHKESLRDNMTDLEVLLTTVGEVTTQELAKEKHPNGLKENIQIAKSGGEVANNTRLDIEKRLGKSIVTKENALTYQHNNDIVKINDDYK